MLALALSTLALGAQTSAQDYYEDSYALVVGINAYEDARSMPNLSYAVKDASAMAEYLEGHGFEVIRLLDREATRARILDTLRDEITPELTRHDRFVFFFAGHGHTVNRGGQDYGYLVVSDSTDSTSSMISMREIQELSEMMNVAKHHLFIVDACYGGLLGTRGSRFNPDHPTYLQDITGRRARQVLTAGGADQAVLDQGEDGHSVFTFALLQALSSGLGDLNGDGWIAFPELHIFLVQSASNRFQTPGTSTLAGHQLGEFVFRTPKGTARPVSPNAGNSEPDSGRTRSGSSVIIEEEPLPAPEVIAMQIPGSDGNEDPSTATPVPPRSIVTNTVGEKGDAADWYVVEFEGPGTISATIANLGSDEAGALAPLMLKTEDLGDLAATHHNGVRPQSENSIPPVSVSGGRPYYVLVGIAPLTPPAKYELRLDFEPEYLPDTLEPNDTRESALELEPTGGLVALVGFGDDVGDSYKIQAPADGLLRWVVIDLHEPDVLHGNLAMTSLENSMQVNIASTHHNGVSPGRQAESSVISVHGGESYYLRVQPAAATHSAPYRLSTVFTSLDIQDQAEPNDSRSEAQPTHVQDSLVAKVGFGADREDWYRVELEQNGLFRFSITNRQVQPVLHGDIGVATLLDSFEEVLLSLHHNGIPPARTESSPAAVVEVGEPYYIRIPAATSTDGAPYVLETSFQPIPTPDTTEPNNGEEEAAPLDPNGKVTATIGFGGDEVDVYSVALERPGEFKLKVTNLLERGVQWGHLSPVKMMDASGNSVAETHHNGAPPGGEIGFARNVELEAGTYYIHVAVSGGHRASYRLESMFRAKR